MGSQIQGALSYGMTHIWGPNYGVSAMGCPIYGGLNYGGGVHIYGVSNMGGFPTMGFPSMGSQL